MVDKLKDLLKQVDKDTRRCIVFLNNKMDDQFKRIMNIKTAPVPPPQPANVTELRAELRREIDEIKAYVKSRDKVNKEAIKKMEGMVNDLLAVDFLGEERVDISDKIMSVENFLSLGEEGVKKYIISNLENTRAVGIECELFIDCDDVSENFIFYHKNFLHTLIHIHNNAYEWLDFIKNLNEYPLDDLPFDDLPFFSLSAIIVTRHLDRDKTHLDPVQHFCLIEMVRAGLNMYAWTQEGKQSLPQEKIHMMARDRDNWLPLKAVRYSLAHQADILSKLEEHK